MRNLFLLFAIFLFTGMQAIFAQRAVTGRVVDTDNQPLPGVSVQVQGTTTGTNTDGNGGFSINVPNNQAVLHFSFIGFNPQDVTVGAQSTINVILTESVEMFSEVVVTALNIRRESKSLGYAVTSVGSDVLTENRSINVMQSLEGRVSGLNISSPAAGASSSTQILLRGQSAFAGGGSTSPLLVINGLPMDQDARSSGTSNANNRDRGDALNSINPDDIESITVLKGGTAAALYGSRAANGAILITTKSGSGRGQAIGIEVSSSLTTQTALNFMELQDLFGHGAAGRRPANRSESMANGSLMWGAPYDGTMIQTPAYTDDGKIIEIPYSYNSMKKRIQDYYRTGTAFVNNVAVSGGIGQGGNFRVSYSNTDSKGIDPVNEYKRNTLNTNLNYKITEKLKFTLSMNYAKESYINPPQGGMQNAGVMNFLTRVSNVYPLDFLEKYAIDRSTGIDRETQLGSWTGTIQNPYYARQKGREWVNDRDRLFGTVTLRYDIIDGLFIQGRYNYDWSYSFTDNRIPAGTGADNPINTADGTYRGSFALSDSKGTDINADFLLGYVKQFNKFSVDVNFGGNTYRVNSHGLNLTVENFTFRDFFAISNGNNVSTRTYNYSRQRTNSLYGTAAFGYNSIFFLNLTGRNDWFSVLHPSNNDQFYPSVSGSFVFSELLKKSWLDYGKLRGSLAQVGSANGLNPYQGLLTYNLGNNQFNGQTTGSFPNNVSNPNPFVQPYTVDEKEIGLEMRLFNKRLYLDLAWFDKVTNGQIMSVSLSETSGFNSSRQNVGSLKNAGFESLIDYRVVDTRNFKWNTAWNNTFLQTKVLSVGYNSDGTPIQVFMAEDWYRNGGSDMMIGQLHYVRGKAINQVATKTYVRNDNGDIVLNANGTLRGTGTYEARGSAMPKFTGGWNNTFRYKNFTASMFFDYRFGGILVSATNLNLTRQGFSKMSLGGRVDENGKPMLNADGSAKYALTFPGVIEIKEQNVVVGYKPNDQVVTNLQGFYTDYRGLQIGDPFIYKSDFIKLRSISLSYDLTGAVNKVDALKFVKGLTVSASCRNVAILYKDIPNLDPEGMQSTGNSLAGYEGLSSPTTRNFVFSLNVRF